MNDSEIVKLLIRKDERIAKLEAELQSQIKEKWDLIEEGNKTLAKLEEENRKLKEESALFSWADINAIAYDEWKEHGGLSNFDSWYVNWLEDNFYPPSKRK